MRHQRRAAFRPVARQNIEHARRQYLIHDLAGAQHGQRRFLGRFHHHRIAGDHGGRDLQRHQHHRYVPWNDRADYADWLAQGHGKHFVAEWDAFTFEFRAEPTVENEYVGENARLDTRFRAQRLARLNGDEAAELLDMLVEQSAAIGNGPAALA